MMINIERTLFWFKDGDEMLLELNDRYFAFGTMLNRFLNENYDGKKIKFINLDFSTEATYAAYPHLPQNASYYYGGHLRFYGVLDLATFLSLSESEQNTFIWIKACEYLKTAAEEINNNSLLIASEYAQKKGLQINLDPDYSMVEADVVIYGQPMKASVWVNFKKDGMYSKLMLKKEGTIVLEKDIDNTKNGVEFFLEMYKGIEAKNNSIIIKGRKDVDYLPLIIPIDKKLVEST